MCLLQSPRAKIPVATPLLRHKESLESEITHPGQSLVPPRAFAGCLGSFFPLGLVSQPFNLWVGILPPTFPGIRISPSILHPGFIPLFPESHLSLSPSEEFPHCPTKPWSAACPCPHGSSFRNISTFSLLSDAQVFKGSKTNMIPGNKMENWQDK